jgi:cell division protein FtsB
MAQGPSPSSRGQGGRGQGGRAASRARRTPAGRPGERGWRTRSAAAVAAAPRPRLTSRAAVLVLVLAVLAVSYASSLRAYLEQRDHLASLRQQITDSEAEIDELRREKQRWRDDAYVVSQARARFAFGFPGEVGFRVLDEDGKPLDQDVTLSDPKALQDDEPEWWETTLDSIETAGSPPPEDSGPAEKITVPPQGDTAKQGQ